MPEVWMTKQRIFTLSILICSAAATAQIREPLRVEGGLIAGTSYGQSAGRVFKGIPYAAPPVGELRWRDPQPVQPWKGVRNATSFSDACMQLPHPKGSYYQVEFYPEPEPVSEDCLYLNVWTPAHGQTDRLPVMVWIHGGGFAQGSGATVSQTGETLARKGAVVVTFNYRLGIFGLFAHPELTKESPHHSSGNYALMDELAALKWVQRNISAFGGDPYRVTVFGQSAGANSIALLIGSPLARGLFQRAAADSGGLVEFFPLNLIEAEQQGSKFASSVGARTLAGLRSLSADALLRASDRQSHPIIDGFVIPEDPYRAVLDRKQMKVPLLLGSVSNERGNYPNPANLKEYEQFTEREFPGAVEEALKRFPAKNDEAVRSVYLQRARDIVAAGMRNWAGLMNAAGTPAYLYYFDRNPPARSGERPLGAVHTSEIVYFRNDLDTVNRPWTAEDRKLAGTMSSYLYNFALKGDPNSSGLPRWPAYDGSQVMELGDHIRPIPQPDSDQVDWIESYFKRRHQDDSHPEVYSPFTRNGGEQRAQSYDKRCYRETSRIISK
jgi:para-nitrobenzyl esterase